MVACLEEGPLRVGALPIVCDGPQHKSLDVGNTYGLYVMLDLELRPHLQPVTGMMELQL